MTRRISSFVHPSRCVVGAIGEFPDQSYFLQVTDETRCVAVQLDPRQVRLLGKRVDQLLDTIALNYSLPVPRRSSTCTDLDPLVMPVDSEFLVGTIGMGWDSTTMSLAIELFAISSEEFPAAMMMQDSAEGPDTVRVFLKPDAAREFARRCVDVFLAGRATCPLCDTPLEGDGHICTRLNGYRRDLSDSIDDLVDYRP